MNPKEKSCDFVIKLLIIGDGNVGKTNLLLRVCENKFVKSHLTTIGHRYFINHPIYFYFTHFKNNHLKYFPFILGMDFKTKNILLDGKKIHMQIWDTAGQDRFRTITKNYYKGAHGIIMAYSINDKNSFLNIDNWMKQIKDNASETVAIILVATKCDVPDRSVQFVEGKKMADYYGVPFIETSAKNDTNVEEAFEIIVRAAKEKINLKNETFIEENSTIVLGSKIYKEENNDESKCAC